MNTTIKNLPIGVLADPWRFQAKWVGRAHPIPSERKALDVETGHELMARSRIVAKTTEHPARHHAGAVLVNPAGRHAAVRGLDDDGDSLGPQNFLDHVRDLGRQALLDLQPARERI